MIEVQPSAQHRQGFARWAVAQVPKIATVSPHAFGVPAGLFIDIPEELMTGALVDGHPYVSPDDEPPTGDGIAQEGPGAIGTATIEGFPPPVLPERWGIPGEPLPPLPDSAYEPGAVALPIVFAAVEGEQQGDGAEIEWPEGITPPDPATVEAAMSAVLLAVDVRNGSDSSDPAAEEAPPYACGHCGRDFTTARGRDMHSRQAHPDTSSEGA